jgi:phage antirepressor YoqD-like protein/phage anti-repressor protein
MRSVHEKLEISTDFTDWFKYQADRLDLVDGRDFTPILGESTGGRPSADYLAPIDIAKNICLMSTGPKAQEIRTYLIEVEKAWNSPASVIARGCQLANLELERCKAKISALTAKSSALEEKVTQDHPKVLFADSVCASETSILIGDLAKLIRQNGYDIGQKRLFEWLRSNGYLMKNSGSKNMPTQRALDMKLFEVLERAIDNPDGSIRITRTTKCTGKGQIYFVNQFLGGTKAA